MNAKDEDGLTALDYAMGRGYVPFLQMPTRPRRDLADLLRTAGGNVELAKTPDWPPQSPPDCHGRLRRRHLAGRPGRTLNAYFPSPCSCAAERRPLSAASLLGAVPGLARLRTRTHKSVSVHDISVKDVSGLAVFAGGGCNVVGLAAPMVPCWSMAGWR